MYTLCIILRNIKWLKAQINLLLWPQTNLVYQGRERGFIILGWQVTNQEKNFFSGKIHGGVDEVVIKMIFFQKEPRKQTILSMSQLSHHFFTGCVRKKVFFPLFISNTHKFNSQLVILVKESLKQKKKSLSSPTM